MNQQCYKLSSSQPYWLFSSFLLLLLLTACAPQTTTSTTTAQQNMFNNIPLGLGSTPEPGTDGKPHSIPNGHWETLFATNNLLYAGSDNGQVYAFNTNTGHVYWQFSIGSAPTPIGIFHDILYVTAHDTLYALNSQNGTPLWNYQVARDISAQMAGNIIVLNTSAEGNIAYLYGVNAITGKLIWQSSFPGITPGLLSASSNTVTYIQTQGDIEHPTQTLFALNTNNGHLDWKFNLASNDALAHGIAEANGVFYLATISGAIYALQGNNGALLWHVTTSTPSFGLAVNIYPTIANNVVYLATRQGLAAYRASNGTLLWQESKELISAPAVQQPVISNDTLYLTTTAGTVLALRTSDGTQRWHQANLSANGQVMLNNGLLQASSINGAFALRADNGQLLWQRNTGNHSSMSSAGPAEIISSNHVYVQNDDGSIDALDVRTGNILWHYAIPELSVQSPPAYSASVTFTKNTSYQQALQIVSSLGLTPTAICTISWQSGRIEQGYHNWPSFMLTANINSAPLWFNRLQANPAVTNLQPNPIYNCPMLRLSNNPSYLPEEQSGTYLRVSFSSSVSYETALTIINNLGFRLAAPCYEQARAQGKKPTWHDMGQQSTFTQNYMLVLATNRTNPITWQQQLQTTKGVTTETVPFKATCQ